MLQRITLSIAAALLLLLAAGCSTGGPTGPTLGNGSTPDPTIGNVKIWLRQYSSGVVGKGGTVSTDQYMVLINESHTLYKDIASDRLLTEEHIIPDSVARRLLFEELKTAGVNAPDSPAVNISMPPDQYVTGLARRPYSWIGIEHALPGHATSWVFIPNYRESAPVGNRDAEKHWEARGKIYLACFSAVGHASQRGFPKDTSKSTTTRDLRREERRAPGNAG
jgi:hypothetical protein